MGRKVSDGKAFNLAVPAGQVVEDGELYRIGGLNGVAVGEVGASDTARTLAFEADPPAIYSIHVPTAVNPAVGKFLFWAAPASFQSGPTNLQTYPAATGDAPCFFVTEARSLDTTGAAYVLRGRVLNGAGYWS